MKIYKQIMGGVAAVEKALMAVITIIVTVITFANVCVRYLTDSQFGWSEEIVVNIFVLMIMCGCALCAREGSLISLSLVFDLVGKKAKKVMVAIITVVNCFFYGIILKTGYEKVLTQMKNGKRTFSLMIPEWIFTLAIVIGAVLLILHTIEFCVDVMADNAPCAKDAEKEGEEE